MTLAFISTGMFPYLAWSIIMSYAKLPTDLDPSSSKIAEKLGRFTRKT